MKQALTIYLIVLTLISPGCTVSIVADKLKLERSIHEILQFLGISLLNKTPVNELFINIDFNNVKELDYIKMKPGATYLKQQ